MDKKQYERLKNGVMDLIETLSHSQGYYCRLLRYIKEAEQNGEDLTDFFMRFKNCKSPVDIVLTLEC